LQGKAKPSSEEALKRENTKQEVDDLITLIRDDFSDRDWKIFYLYVAEERPVEEIADELGVSTNVVYLAKSRILRRFKQVFGKTGD